MAIKPNTACALRNLQGNSLSRLVWQLVLQQLKQSNSAERMLGSDKRKRSWLFVGCGTSLYLADAAATSWTLLTGESTRAVPASEVLLYPALTRLDGPDVRAVVISRSGRTSEAVRAAHVLRKELHIPIVGITCAENSALEAACDFTLVLRPADEKSMVMTRSFTSMLISLQWLAAEHAGNTEFVQSLETMAEQFGTHPIIGRRDGRVCHRYIRLKTMFFLAKVPSMALRAKAPSK